MAKAKSNKLKAAIIILSVLLALSISALCATLVYYYIKPSDTASVSAPDNVITPDTTYNAKKASSETSLKPSTDDSDTAAAVANASELSGESAEKLYLYKANPDDNTSFNVGNMLPGDSITKYYCVKTTYKNNVTVRYHADIRSGSYTLAKALNCRIKLITTGETLYDGAIGDMPKSLNYTLPYKKSSGDAELYYEITAYLDTSVGNDCANRSLTADFRWWVEDTENLDNPNTGILTAVFPWIILAGGLLLAILLIASKCRKEEQNEQ